MINSIFFLSTHAKFLVFSRLTVTEIEWNDNMREKREPNANATRRALIRDRPRGDGV
jgi:hypothetical protein